MGVVFGDKTAECHPCGDSGYERLAAAKIKQEATAA